MKFTLKLFILLTLTGCAPKVYTTLSWQDKPVQVDGQSNEWEIPVRYFDKTTQLNYEFTNDAENLYFVARTADQTTIQQVLMSGITLSLDTLPKSKDYPFTLQFPVHSFPNFNQGSSGNMQQGPPSGGTPPQSMDGNMPEPPGEGNFAQFGDGPSEIKLGGFNHIKGDPTLVAMENAHGIYANCATDSLDILFYELVIPFKTFIRGGLTAEDSLMVFSCEITIEGGGMPEQQGPQGGGGNSGMSGPPGGGGGMGGGMMGGPQGGGPGMGGGMPSGGGMDDAQSNSDKCEIYVTFSPAIKF